MILLGCLLAFGAAVAPRVFLVLAWIFSARWPLVWGGDFILPLLGIIFLPFTTIMYMLVWTPRGIEGWDWMWIILGLFLDFWKWSQIWANRQKGMEVAQDYYGSGARRGPTTGSSSASSVSPATTPSVPAATAGAPTSSTPSAAAGTTESSGGSASPGADPPA